MIDTTYTGLWIDTLRPGFGLQLLVENGRTTGVFFAHRYDGSQLFLTLDSNSPVGEIKLVEIRSNEFPSGKLEMNAVGVITLRPLRNNGLGVNMTIDNDLLKKRDDSSKELSKQTQFEFVLQKANIPQEDKFSKKS